MTWNFGKNAKSLRKYKNFPPALGKSPSIENCNFPSTGEIPQCWEPLDCLTEAGIENEAELGKSSPFTLLPFDSLNCDWLSLFSIVYFSHITPLRKVVCSVPKPRNQIFTAPPDLALLLTLLHPGGGVKTSAAMKITDFSKKFWGHILKARGLIFYNLTIFI